MLLDVGATNPVLQITFGQHALNADGNEGPDRPTGGYQLVDWDEWFAAFDAEQLGLKVNDEVPGALDNDFEFVAADDAAATTDAARQPAPDSVAPAGRRD